MEYKKISIVGNGIMGKGLAHNFAFYGYKVVLWGRRDKKELGKELCEYLDNERIRNRINKDELNKILKNIDVKNITDDKYILHESDLIIETVVESILEKKKILRTISENCKDGAVISTNTSTLPVQELAESIKNKENFLGIHFFSPVPYNNLVEVSKTTFTSKKIASELVEVLKALNKYAFLVEDIPGFVFNRMLLCTINESMYLLENMKDMNPADIDDIFSIGWNVKYGPLKLIDLIGLDTILNCLTNMYHYTGLDKFKPAQILVNYVKQGRLGKKSGSGFYNYSQEM